MKERKKTIQLKLKQVLNLNISIPLPDGGNTDDGNTARKALKNYAILAEILGKIITFEGCL